MLAVPGKKYNFEYRPDYFQHQARNRGIFIVTHTLWLLSILLFAFNSSALGKPNKELQIYVQTALNEIFDNTVNSKTGVEKSDLDMLDQLFTQVVAYGSARDDVELFREVVLKRRMVKHLLGVDKSQRYELLIFLREHPRLSNAMVLLGEQQNDKQLAEAYAVLSKLRNSGWGSSVNDKYANLVAALCFVHDVDFQRGINENLLKSPDVVDIFGYYLTNEKRMEFGIQDMPAELLTYVVDTTATIDEMQWALDRYDKDRNVGKRFFEIKYDLQHVTQGTAKKCTTMGYNLPNILLYGGVCADQAYYAVSVGKALGIPTAYTTGCDATVGHAWAGYLETRGRTVKWNFSAGRYQSYQAIRGSVIDPVTLKIIPDSYAAILAELSHTSELDRENAMALTDAALFLKNIENDNKSANYPPDSSVWAGTDSKTKRKVRNLKARSITDPTEQEDLLEAALRNYPEYINGWLEIGNLAEKGVLNFDRCKYWSDSLFKLCGRAYPDFCLDVVTPMISSVSDYIQQNELWDNAFKIFNYREDLAANIRFTQGKLFEDNGDDETAVKYYEDIINRFLESGPFVIQALDRIDKLLIKHNQADRILDMYKNVWNRLKPPRQSAVQFFRQSNWFIIGFKYSQYLRQAGDIHTADSVENRLRNER